MALREVLANFKFNVDQKGLKTANRGIQNFTKLAAQAGTVLGGVFGASALINDFKQTAAAADDLAKRAKRIALPVEQLEQLEFIADRAGLGQGVLAKGFATLAKNAGEARDGIATYKDEFDKLGVTVTTGDGQLKGIQQLFDETTASLSGLGNETEKLAIAQNLFGRAGKQLLPILEGGEQGIEALRQRFEELGGGFGADFAKQAEEFADAEEDLELATRGLRVAILKDVIGPITDGIKVFTKWIAEIRRNPKEMERLKQIITATGVAIATFAAVMLASLIPAILTASLVAAAMVIVFDEIITGLNGGETAIGSFIDSTFGLGTSEAFFAGVRDIIDLVGHALSAIIPTIGHLISRFDAFFESIKPELQLVGDLIAAAWDISPINLFIKAATKAASLFGIDLGSKFSNLLSSGEGGNAAAGGVLQRSFIPIDGPGGPPAAAGNTANVNNNLVINTQTSSSSEDIGKIVGAELDRSARRISRDLDRR